ncbi:MAG TPA: HlyD family secretion protein [Tepidisphaeraceae bacterium]|jgi:membrane fusion protein (multidrug efflux system)|nr:HlyD family secretion protein [Tepidisphaeraceae bacterium]
MPVLDKEKEPAQNEPSRDEDSRSRKDDHSDKEDSKSKEKDSKPGDEGSEPKKPFWKRPVLLFSIIGVVLLLSLGGLIWWLLTRNYEKTDDAFIDGRMIHVAPRVAGRVASLDVDDNQFVEAGAVLIRIDKAPFQASYENAQAMLQQAQVKVQQSQADLTVQQANAEQAKADVVVAQANAANAEADFRRYQSVAPAARSQQQVDTSTANAKSTAAQVIAAQKKAASAEAQVKSSQTAIDAAKSQVLAAQAQLDEAALNLQYTDVTAGQAGFVTRRTVEKGNYVQVGQEILVVVPKNVWVTANYKETQLTYMRPGQPVEIEVDAFPGRTYRAHVDSIQTGTGAVFSVLPPENATGNYVKIVQRVPVKVIFDEPLDRVLAPGESVEPRVDIRTGR